MDSVTDICKYHFLCFMTIIQVKVISGDQVKEVKQKKNHYLELRYMFLGQIFAKNAKNDPKTLFEASKSVKKQNSENHGKVPKWREKGLFLTFLCYISAIFEDIDLKFCTHILETLPSNICYGFWKFWFEGETVLKRKIFGHFFEEKERKNIIF